MIDFTIDKEKCIKCKLCATECPVLIINAKTEFPEIKEGKEKNCIKCQHCLAVCPTAALSIWGKNPDDSLEVNEEIPQPQEMERLIKTRRSVRRFKKEELGADTIKSLLETSAYAPSGHNKNQVLLSVTATRSETDKVKALVYEGIKSAMENNNLRPALGMFANFQNMWEEKGVDVLFRNAPHFIIASAPKENSNGYTDCIISLSYFELLANSMQIATLWDGLVKMVFETIAPDLKTSLGIPKDHEIAYMMVFGKPGVKYARSVQSEGLNLNTIQL